MEKYRLYRVSFMIPKQGYILNKAVDLITTGPREAITETRKFVFRETGEHASRCKAKLVSL